MSARMVRPHCSRPGSRRWPGLRRQKVTVSSRPRRGTRGSSPVAPSHAGRHVDGDHRRAAALPAPRPAASATPSSGRASPAPNRASTTSSAPAGPSTVAGLDRPRPAGCRPGGVALQRRAIGTSVATRTGQPARCSCRATTQPSPPLLPGPHRTSVGCRPKRASDRAGDGSPGVLHQPGPGQPGGDRRPIDRAPWRRGQAARRRRACLRSAIRACGSGPGRRARSRPRPDGRYGAGGGSSPASAARPPPGGRRRPPRRRRARRRSRAAAPTGPRRSGSSATSRPSSCVSSSAQALPTSTIRSGSKPANTGR